MWVDCVGVSRQITHSIKSVNSFSRSDPGSDPACTVLKAILIQFFKRLDFILPWLSRKNSRRKKNIKIFFKKSNCERFFYVGFFVYVYCFVFLKNSAKNYWEFELYISQFRRVSLAYLVWLIFCWKFSDFKINFCVMKFKIDLRECSNLSAELEM